MARTLSVIPFVFFSLVCSAFPAPGARPVAARSSALMRSDASAAAGTAAPSAETPLPRVEETGVRFGAGELREPVGVAVDALGFVYVADAAAGKVFRFDETGGSLEFSRPPEQAGFYPIDVAAQESFVFVLDYAGNRLLRYDAKGTYLDVFISFGTDGARPGP